MRRPAPLPPPPEEPNRPKRSARPVAVWGDSAQEDDVEPAHDEAEPAVDAETEDVNFEAVTQRDVWRAARARRKALKSEIRRFTQRSRRKRIVWMSVLGALVVLVGGSALAAYSPLFAVEKVTVVGTSTLDPAAVETALSGQIGTPLALVDASEVKAALLAFPLIETYTLEAEPPHGLTVRLVERTPVGVLDQDSGYVLVDAAGVVLSVSETAPEGQPILSIEGGVESDAFEAAGIIVRTLPADLRAQLSEVRATSPDDVALVIGERTVVWGSAEKSGAKALALQGLIQANPTAKTFDVSSPNVGIVG